MVIGPIPGSTLYACWSDLLIKPPGLNYSYNLPNFPILKTIWVKMFDSDEEEAGGLLLVCVRTTIELCGAFHFFLQDMWSRVHNEWIFKTAHNIEDI